MVCKTGSIRIVKPGVRPLSSLPDVLVALGLALSLYAAIATFGHPGGLWLAAGVSAVVHLAALATARRPSKVAVVATKALLVCQLLALGLVSFAALLFVGFGAPLSLARGTGAIDLVACVLIVGAFVAMALVYRRAVKHLSDGEPVLG
jgi:hypothetical protein